jgi:alpha-methylacyl-CoA racemase
VADFGGGAMFLITGLLAGLLHARATGDGQVVDAAMTEGAAYLGSMTRTFLAMGGWTDRRAANMLDGGAPNYRCYECADGRWVAVGALESQFWAALVATLGLGDDAPSPYDATQWPACTEALTQAFKAKTRDEWAEIFAPLDACVAPVLTLEEAPTHPHNVARRSYTEVGEAMLADAAPRFSATPGAAGPITPIGGNSAAILAELGYSETNLTELRESGTIG